MADLGDTLPFRCDLYDKPVEQGGVLVNATTAALTITLPDGTTTTPSITNPPATTGKYLLDYVTTLASPPGRYVGQWLFTMAGGKTTSYVESFDVGSSLVTVDEAVAHLRAAQVISGAVDLEQLQTLCLDATDIVERDLGRVLMRRTVTEIHTGGSSALVLRNTPVISVTSVTASGVLLDPSAYLIDGSAGILYAGSTFATTLFAMGQRNVAVVYVAGYTDPPRAARVAAKQLVQSMYQQSQQASHPLLDESSPEAFAAAALPGLNQIPGYSSLRVAGVA